MAQHPGLSSLLSEASRSDDLAARDRAFDELMRLLTIFVRAGMGAGVRRHRESMDICQSVVKSFVADLQAGALSFPNEAALVAYLKQVVRTKLAEAARHDAAQKRGGGAGAVALAGGATDRSELEAEPPGRDPTASIVVAGGEFEDRLVRGLNRDEMELVRLRRAGLEWEQIAERMGKNSAALRKMWSRMQERAMRGTMGSDGA